MKPRDHQFHGVKQIYAALEHVDSLCLAAPTAAGKTLCQAAIVNLCLANDLGCIIYNARRPLTNQVSRVLEDAGIHHGARAASMKSKKNLHALIQCASIQTDIQRVIKQEVWKPHDAAIMIVDEAHVPECKSELAQQLFQRYLSQGTKIVGMTGTPLGLSEVYADVIDLVKNSELRRVGSHVPAETYSLHEMDVSKIKPTKTGEYKEGDITKELWSPSIVGYAFEDWRKLNPDALPTLAACPSVDTSVWVANQWLEKGYRVAHIDANECVVNGERYKNDAEGKVREQVLEDARKGRFHLISNCLVLQAGIDIPNLEHLIILRPFGSLENYIQFCGRGIRSSPGKDKCIIQDHCGAAVRHGSINADRDWGELFYETAASLAEKREEQLRKEEGEKPPEPIICGKCGKMREGGVQCPKCGHKSEKSERIIVEHDGTLRKLEGELYKPAPKRKKSTDSDYQKHWDKLFWSSKKKPGPGKMTFQYAARIFKNKWGAYPNAFNLKRIPKGRDGWKMKIKEADFSDLT